MKFKNMFITLGLALGLGVGVVAGVSANRNVKIEKAEALSISANNLYIDFSNSDWTTASAVVAICYQDDGSNEAWSSAAASTDVANVYTISAPSLGFTPTKAFALRLRPSGATGYSDANGGLNWTNKWNQASMTPITKGVIITSAMDSVIAAGSVSIKGGLNPWSVTTIDVPLTNLKRNGPAQWEFYGDVEMPDNSEFKVYVDGSAYAGKFECESSLSSIITGDQYNNIQCSTGAVYEMFYKVKDYTVYVTDPSIARADQFAQNFLTATSVCDPDGITNNITSVIWTAQKDAFDGLIPAAQELVTNAVANESGTYLQQFGARYNYIVNKYGTGTFSDFAGRISAGTLTYTYKGLTQPVDVIENSTNNNTALIIVLSIAAVSVLALGGYFYVRSRKED